ncbi:hypothetical protein ACQQ2N_04465 [Dokdonella sp. MW10]|uniref:hypothetical protein n=1 Tax=Dokdonella sp. MW10 TaxID=2992926 RepID=UPI003F7F0613
MDWFWSASWRFGTWLVANALRHLDSNKRQRIVDADAHAVLSRVVNAWLDRLTKLRDDLKISGTKRQQDFFYSLGPPHSLTTDAVIILPPKEIENYKDLLGVTGVGGHLMAAHAKAWAIFDACAEGPKDADRQMERLTILISRLEVTRESFLSLLRSGYRRSD